MSKSDTTADDQIERLVLLAPFWGPAPGSNLWPLIELTKRDGTSAIDGECINEAWRRGWLTATQKEEAGYVMPDGDGGTELYWRYEAAPAWRTIIQHRRRVRG